MKAPTIYRTLYDRSRKLGWETTHPTNHANTTHKIVHTLLAWKKTSYMYTPNNVLDHT